MRMSGLVSFLGAGIPGFLIALPLNMFLVETIRLGIEISYLFVLFIQVSINFCTVRTFLFDIKDRSNILPQYIQFLLGMFLFRFFDWLIYIFLVKATNVHYLLVQAGNIILFSFLKYKFTKKVME